MHELLSFLILFSLGVAGWGLFSLIRAPVPALLGTLVLIGTLRVLELPVPPAPDLLDPLVQVLLGVFIGSRITRETVRDLKNLFKPAFMVSVWALLLVFVFGWFLAQVSGLDPVTAVLSSSVGGLPEMTVLAMATRADVAVVIAMKLIRALIIIAVFPVLFRRSLSPLLPAGSAGASGAVAGPAPDTPAASGTPPTSDPHPGSAPDTPGHTDADMGDDYTDGRGSAGRSTDSSAGASRGSAKGGFSVQAGIVAPVREVFSYLSYRPHELVLTLAVASAGSMMLARLGVPAGIMVGAIIAVGTASAAGLPIRSLHRRLFDPLLILLGIMVSQHFGPATGQTLAAGGLVWPLFVSTLVIFLTSLIVAWAIHRFARWNLPLSFLCAAPGGFTVMTSLALYYGLDAFRVSMIHLARLLSIKIVVPLVFTFML